MTGYGVPNLCATHERGTPARLLVAPDDGLMVYRAVRALCIIHRENGRIQTVRGMKMKKLILLVLLGLSMPLYAADHAPRVIPANQVIADYRNNEVAADAKYNGKTVRVRGVVQEVGVDVLNQPYVSLGGRGGLESVQCTFPESAKASLMHLSKGRVATVQGVITGKTIGIVSLDHAVLVTSK